MRQYLLFLSQKYFQSLDLIEIIDSFGFQYDTNGLYHMDRNELSRKCLILLLLQMTVVLYMRYFIRKHVLSVITTDFLTK